jgi:DNA-binding transcriptional MerR regulator
VTRTANGRAHLSIGEVLSLLQDEFPDVTISKIRFLESQGLLDPERTPSGYRKFYDADIQRLRWILRQQKDHYLPLKVIRDRLDKGEDVDQPPQPEEVAPSTNGTSSARPAAGRVAVTERSTSRSRPATRPRTVAPPPSSSPPSVAPELDAAGRVADVASTESPRPAVPTGDAPLSLSVEELAEASGLSVRDVRDLERFGLIEARDGGESGSYDADALIIARTAAGFLQHGIEARHMRTYKVAADREAGLFEQIVSPVLKQRNPEARTRAARTVTELIRLGEVMRGVLLRRELRDLGP